MLNFHYYSGMNSEIEESVFANCRGVREWHLVEFQWEPEVNVLRYVEAIMFCKHDITGRWFKNLRIFWFEDPQDAVLFKLRFG